MFDILIKLLIAIVSIFFVVALIWLAVLMIGMTIQFIRDIINGNDIL